MSYQTTVIFLVLFAVSIILIYKTNGHPSGVICDDPNAAFNECGNVCVPAVCPEHPDYSNSSIVCLYECVPGCFCNTGYGKEHDKCVKCREESKDETVE